MLYRQLTSKTLQYIHRGAIGLHWLVLAATAILACVTGADTLAGLTLAPTPLYLRLSLWVCILMAAEVCFSWYTSTRTRRSLLIHGIFLLLAVPYLNLFTAFGWHISSEALYILRFLPMARGAYILWDMVALLTRNRSTSLILVYIFLLIVAAVFASMMFFVVERTVNPEVTSYPLALWWAVMNMTTCGCYIPEITATGRVLSVLLSSLGIMVFPVFTVYITHVAGDRR